MFHKAIELNFKEGTVLEVAFRDGKVKQYDVSVLFGKYPQMRALEDRALFLSGRLIGFYGIVWNDELDIEAETVYNEGELLRTVEIPARYLVGQAISDARTTAGMTQSELSKLCGIDQSDLSKLERGQLNPSIATLERITKALGCKLSILIQQLG